MRQLKLDQFSELIHTFNDQELTMICKKVYHELSNKKDENIVAEFYPYTNIKLTVNKQNNRLQIRMADLISDAPEIILVSAAKIIISRSLNKKCDEKARGLYREYIYSEEIRSKVKTVRKSRTRKKSSQPKGKFFDLEECFDIINSSYFNGKLKKPVLMWSARRSRTSVGHYDMDLDILVISKKLDTRKTPKYVVEFVIYHELLHQQYPGKFINGRWVVHSPEFKKSEKLFKNYKFANYWLKQF